MAAAAAKGHGFTKEQIAEYREHFNEYDEDKSGTVEAKELKSVLSKCGIEMTDGQVVDMIKEVDKDGSGNLDFDEFLMLMAKVQSGPGEKEIRSEIFRVRRARRCATSARPHVLRMPGCSCVCGVITRR